LTSFLAFYDFQGSMGSDDHDQILGRWPWDVQGADKSEVFYPKLPQTPCRALIKRQLQPLRRALGAWHVATR
jgi:hypothetical protein